MYQSYFPYYICVKTGSKIVTSQNYINQVSIIGDINNKSERISRHTIAPPSSSESPNWMARFETACAADSTLIFSLYINQWFWHSILARSNIVLESAIRPLTAQPEQWNNHITTTDSSKIFSGHFRLLTNVFVHFHNLFNCCRFH